MIYEVVVMSLLELFRLFATKWKNLLRVSLSQFMSNLNIQVRGGFPVLVAREKLNAVNSQLDYRIVKWHYLPNNEQKLVLLHRQGLWEAKVTVLSIFGFS